MTRDRRRDTACPRCGYNRWRTLKKHHRWRCRRCAYIRELAESAPEEGESRATS